MADSTPGYSFAKLYRTDLSGKEWEDLGPGTPKLIIHEATVLRRGSVGLAFNSKKEGSKFALEFPDDFNLYRRYQPGLFGWTATECQYSLSFNNPEKGDAFFQDVLDAIQANNPAEDGMKLPEAELANLKEIASIIASTIALPTTDQRKSLCVSLQKEGYLKKLLEIFEQAEDLEDEESLAHLYAIFRDAIMLNDSGILDILLSNQYLLKVIGVLEYDPDVSLRVEHRKFLTDTARFHEVVPLRDSALADRIHQNFRIQYLKDTVLPRVLDDETYQLLDTIVYFANCEIVGSLTQSPYVIGELFSELHRRLEGSVAFPLTPRSVRSESNFSQASYASHAGSDAPPPLTAQKSPLLHPASQSPPRVRPLSTTQAVYAPPTAGGAAELRAGGGAEGSSGSGSSIVSASSPLVASHTAHSSTGSPPTALAAAVVSAKAAADAAVGNVKGDDAHSGGGAAADSGEEGPGGTGQGGASEGEEGISALEAQRGLERQSDDASGHDVESDEETYATALEGTVGDEDDEEGEGAQTVSQHDIVDYMGLLQSMCLESRMLSPSERHGFYSRLFEENLMSIFPPSLAHSDRKVRQMASDVLFSTILNDAAVVRQVIISERGTPVGSLLPLLVKRLWLEPDTGIQEQILECLKALLDANPEETADDPVPTFSGPPGGDGGLPKARPNAGDTRAFQDFRNFFYEMGLAEELLDVITGRRGLDGARLDNARLVAINLLTFCVTQHSIQGRFFCIQHKGITKVIRLLTSKRIFVKLAAVRFLRTVLAKHDAAMTRHIVEQKVFRLVFDALNRTEGKDNMLNSALLEMFNFTVQRPSSPIKARPQAVIDLLRTLVRDYDADMKKHTYVHVFDIMRAQVKQFDEIERAHERRQREEEKKDITGTERRKMQDRERAREEAYFEAEEEPEEAGPSPAIAAAAAVAAPASVPVSGASSSEELAESTLPPTTLHIATLRPAGTAAGASKAADGGGLVNYESDSEEEEEESGDDSDSGEEVYGLANGRPVLGKRPDSADGTVPRRKRRKSMASSDGGPRSSGEAAGAGGADGGAGEKEAAPEGARDDAGGAAQRADEAVSPPRNTTAGGKKAAYKRADSPRVPLSKSGGFKFKLKNISLIKHP